MDVFLPAPDLMLVVVDGQVPDRIGAALGDLVVVRGGAGVADRRADTGQKLGRAERLGQIVVRAEVERADLVML